MYFDINRFKSYIEGIGFTMNGTKTAMSGLVIYSASIATERDDAVVYFTERGDVWMDKPNGTRKNYTSLSYGKICNSIVKVLEFYK